MACMYIFPSTLSPQAYSMLWVSLHQWHAWFGHLSMQIVSLVLSKASLLIIKSSKEGLCHSCQSKYHQLPCNITPPQLLLFTDVWDPAPIISHGSFHYYLSFVDDYSRFTWIFSLKCKSNITTVFLSFKLNVKTLLNTKIRILLSDWDGKLCSLNRIFIVLRYFSLIVFPLCSPKKWHSLAKISPYHRNWTCTPCSLVYLSPLLV